MRYEKDESAPWLALLVIATVLAARCMGCSEPAPRPETPSEDELIELEIESAPNSDAGASADPSPPLLPRPAEPGAVPAVISVTQAPPAYRDPRLLRRCRAEAARDTALSETEESKDVARERGRALARAGALDEVLMLARIAYGETGTPRPENDDPATPIWEEVHAFLAVIDARRGSMSRLEMFATYSPRRVFPHPDDTRQRWIAELERSGRRPPSWPAPRGARHHRYPSWRHYGCPRWLATLEAVERTLARVPARVDTGPCRERPDHWGGAPGIDDHAERLGWRRVDCGPTSNRFWVVP